LFSVATLVAETSELELLIKKAEKRKPITVISVSVWRIFLFM
jgi:hypothetical protein